MLTALADPEHPDHAEVAEYLEGMDPKEINELPLKIALGHIANRRRCCSDKDRQEKGLSGRPLECRPSPSPDGCHETPD